MQTHPLRRCFAGLIVLVFSGLSALAQSPGTGSITGRVFDASSGHYVEDVQVNLAGSARTVVTDQSGAYLMPGVPAGAATIRFTYTGHATAEKRVAVEPGQTATANVTLAEAGAGASSEAVIQLEEMHIEASKEMSGADIAVNEQHYAPNVKEVVAADEFGEILDGNVGEFLQFLPGVTVDNAGSSEPKVISVRGLPPGSTPVLVNGFQLASASESAAARVVYLADNSINSMSRIEVNLSHTPDQRADAVGGSVNMITRSAFEFAQPMGSFHLYGSYRDGAHLFGSTPGPHTTSINHTTPGYDFTYIQPVSDRFGFTVNASHNEEWGPAEYESQGWSPNNAIVAPSGSYSAPVAAPFMYRYNPMIGGGFTNRDAFGASMDFKATDRDTVSCSLIYGYFDLSFFNRAVTFNTGGTPSASSYGPTFTQGAVGKGSDYLAISSGQSDSFRHETGTTSMPSLWWHHLGPVWKMNAGISFSQNSNHYRDTADGFFQSMEVSMGNEGGTFNGAPNNGVTNPLNGPPITVSYSGITKNGPAAIAVTDASGNPIDYNNLNNYIFRGASSNPEDGLDTVKQALGSAQRDFELPGANLLTLKIGGDVRQQTRDVTHFVDGQGNQSWTYVGPDGVPGGPNETAGVLAVPAFTNYRMPLGGPIFTYPDPFAAYQLFKQHPSYFVANTLGEFINDASSSNNFWIQETVPAAYVRADAKLFNNKLWLIGGVRYEDTEDRGQGLLRTSAVTPTTLAQAQSIYFPRAQHVTSVYHGFYPSFNATYYLTPDTDIRAAYGKTIFRPDFGNIIPNTAFPSANGAASDVISVSNPSLAPWTADNYEVIAEHYFDNAAGVISVGGFERLAKNFFATITRPITPQDEAAFNLDPSIYGSDDISELVNVSSARIAGFDWNYRQGLQGLSFMPSWAGGILFFTNGTIQRVTGPASVPSTFAQGGSSQTNFTNFINKTLNWGISYSRPRYTLKLQYNYRGTERGSIMVTQSTLNGNTATAGSAPSYNYTPAQYYCNLSGEYRLTKNVALFFTVRDAFNNDFQNTSRYVAGSGGTPGYATLYAQEEFNTLYQFGVKGHF